MRPRERRDSGEQDLFRARLDQIIDIDHPLAKLAWAIDWRFLEDKFGAVYTEEAGRPPLPTRLMVGLAILKHTFNLSDEAVCERWIENPYYQYLCGETFFQHTLPLDRSSITRWRNRMGAGRLEALLQESLALATRSGAMKPSDLSRVIVDTTVQPKNITFPADAKLLNRARDKLVKLAARTGIKLRQSYKRVGKLTLIRHQRYAHARQFKRANRALRKLKTYLGRVIRDAARKLESKPSLKPKFARLLALTRRVLSWQRGERGPKVYSLHAPEAGCIGKGKPHQPYEFGVKVSVAAPLKRCQGGQSAIHAQALPGNPYDGHTLAKIIPAIEHLIGNQLERLHADAGYRGHNAPPAYTFKVYTSKQKRGVTRHIKREMRRRAAIEPVIGHIKNEHRMDRNYLHHRHGDANNAILASAGYNFSLLLRWLRFLLCLLPWRLAPPRLGSAPAIKSTAA